jgi:hypothetical protein
MRTTVELPPDVLRAAKARSAESGESLKTLLTRAVTAELDLYAVRRGQKARVVLPLFGRSSGRRVRPSNADLERVLADGDVAALSSSSASSVGLAKSRRRSRSQ